MASVRTVDEEPVDDGGELLALPGAVLHRLVLLHT